MASMAFTTRPCFVFLTNFNVIRRFCGLCLWPLAFQILATESSRNVGELVQKPGLVACMSIMAAKWHHLMSRLFLVYRRKTMDIRKLSERYAIPNHDCILQLYRGKCTNCRYHAIRKYFPFWITHPTRWLAGCIIQKRM